MKKGGPRGDFLLPFLLCFLLLAAPPARAAEDPPADETHGEHDHDHDSDHGDEKHPDGGHGHTSRLSDEPRPLQLEGFPGRPKPLVEIGEPFLGTGTLHPGFRLPTGAVWQPTLLAFGNFRTAVQTFDAGPAQVTELATRLDLFLNLQLTGTERLVLGFRPLDENGRFTSYFFEHPAPGLEGEFRDELDAEIETLFFEGEVGEIFPNFDRADFRSLDVGFSVGRQPLFFQEGILIDDTLDAVGVTRNTLLPRGTSNFRVTFLGAWDNVHSGPFERDASLYAVLTSADVRRSTLDVDVAYVDARDRSGDLLSGGVTAVQRIGKLSTSFHLLGSVATDVETPFSTDGALFLSEVSWIPHYTHDHVYFTTFWAVDEFSAAARGPATGGPLGRAGINFAAVGLGSYGAPLSSRAREVAGGAFGYQKFFDQTRKQLIVEAGARFGTAGDVGDAYALTARWQTALGRRFVVVVDGFGGGRDEPGIPSETLYGGRLELQIKF